MVIYQTNQLNEIATSLKEGKALILPTDTVYGIVSCKLDKIYEIKKRPLNKKVVVFIPSIDHLDLPIDIKKEIDRYWPGGLTIIWKQVGYRIPKSDLIIKLLDEVGPLYSSSANISGKDPIQSLDAAQREFAESEQDLCLVNQEGFVLSNSPSTIIDLDTMKVLRSGQLDGQKILDNINKIIKERK